MDPAQNTTQAPVLHSMLGCNRPRSSANLLTAIGMDEEHVCCCCCSWWLDCRPANSCSGCWHAALPGTVSGRPCVCVGCWALWGTGP